MKVLKTFSIPSLDIVKNKGESAFKKEFPNDVWDYLINVSKHIQKPAKKAKK